MKDTVKKAGRAMEDRCKNGWKENSQRRRVVRRLFQEDDDVDNRNVNVRNEDARNRIIIEEDLAEQLRQYQDDDRRRWNFDFRTETPLPGRYQWERMDNNHVEQHGIVASGRPSDGVNDSRDRQPTDIDDEEEKKETKNSER